MKIPDKIYVLGHEFDVQYDLVHDNIATVDFYHHIIQIRKDVYTQESKMAEAFLHELIEIIKNKLELDLDHKILTIISEILFDIIRRNNINFLDQT